MSQKIEYYIDAEKGIRFHRCSTEVVKMAHIIEALDWIEEEE